MITLVFHSGIFVFVLVEEPASGLYLYFYFRVPGARKVIPRQCMTNNVRSSLYYITIDHFFCSRMEKTHCAHMHQCAHTHHTQWKTQSKTSTIDQYVFM